MKDEAARGAERVHAARDALGPQALQAPTIDLQHLEAGREVPDVGERDGGELAAPSGGDEAAAQKGGELVAQALPARETRVG